MSFYVTDKVVTDLFYSLGKYPKSSESHEKILRYLNNKDLIIYFLRGLIDGDGNFYIKCILNRLTALNLDGELDVLYEETENLEERVEFLDCLGNEDVSFYFDDEDLN